MFHLACQVMSSLLRHKKEGIISSVTHKESFTPIDPCISFNYSESKRNDPHFRRILKASESDIKTTKKASQQLFFVPSNSIKSEFH